MLSPSSIGFEEFVQFATVLKMAATVSAPLAVLRKPGLG